MAVLGADSENEGEEIEEGEEGVEGDGGRTRGPEATHQYRAPAAAAPRRRRKALSSLREWWWSRRKCSGPTRSATNISSSIRVLRWLSRVPVYSQVLFSLLFIFLLIKVVFNSP